MTERPFAEAAKRVVDVLFVLLLAPLAIPLCAVFAVWIRSETPGKALFRQVRVGRHGAPFTIFKLRTMVDNAEQLGAGHYAVANDPRFTRVGVLARRLSVDELPQLINVLKGEMSVVGPRPMLPGTVQQYAEDYRVILAVRPGLTGLAQVSGRNEIPRSRRLEFDREYATGWTIGGDLALMVRTFRVVLGGSGQKNEGLRKDVER